MSGLDLKSDCQPMLGEFNVKSPGEGILFLRYLVQTLFIGLNEQFELLLGSLL